jgi:hypothetical protein
MGFKENCYGEYPQTAADLGGKSLASKDHPGLKLSGRDSPTKIKIAYKRSKRYATNLAKKCC